MIQLYVRKHAQESPVTMVYKLVAADEIGAVHSVRLYYYY